MPSLAIVIPTKNEEQFLPILFASIQEQTLQPNEIIIADAGSTDKTRTIAQSFGARVVEGGLPGPGRNRGAAVVTSDIILFLDADVILQQKTFLEEALREFEARSLDIATADIVLPRGGLYDQATHRFYNAYARFCGSLYPHAPGFCIFVRRSLHEAIGGFDETVQFCEDHEYAHRAAKKGTFGFLDSVRIAVTTRRQERDGRFVMAIKYIFAEIHTLLLGPIRHDKFKYGFGYTPEVVKKVQKAKETGYKKER